MTRKPRAAVLHPEFREVGGSEAGALRLIEALEDDYDITLVTMGSPDLARLNRFQGTHLDPERLRVVAFPIPAFARRRFAALRSARAARYCREHASEFDVMISTYSVADFGVRGIQFIADLSFADALRESVGPGARLRAFGSAGSRLVREPYLSLARTLSGASRDGWKRNLTIANSDWTARIMRKTFGIEARRIYPPVVDIPAGPPWEAREPGFVYLGRISPEKGIETIIGILEGVRLAGSDVHLHIVGEAEDPAYMDSIRDLCRRNPVWISLEGKMGREEKTAFLGRHRYGISGRRNEPFGISVAEMAKAGCLVWVPEGGGQTEIVGRPELIFSSPEEAVLRIGRVLRDETLQTALRKDLEARKEMFSVERYKREVRRVVSDFLGGLAEEPSP